MELSEQKKTGQQLIKERRKLLDKMHLGLSDKEKLRLDELDDLILQLPINANPKEREMFDQVDKTLSLLNKISKPIEGKSDEGIIIGLIDSLVIIFNVLRPKMQKYMDDELTPEILNAMKDLVEDEDVKIVLRSVHSGYIVSDESVKVFNKLIGDLKNSKIKIEI